MSNCIIYARVNQPQVARKGDSIQGQIETCRAYAQKNKLKIIGEFSDFASGNAPTLQREGLLDALTTLKNGDYLLVTDLDRIARNTTEFFIVRKHLKKHDCKLIAVKSIFDTDDTDALAVSELMCGIFAAMNHYFHEIESRTDSE